MAGIVNVGWLNANALRAYPLSEEATRQDTSLTYTLPNDFLVDFVITINGALSYDPDSFYLAGVTVFGTGIVLEFSYWDGAVEVPLGTVSIQVSSFTPNKTYTLTMTDVFEGVVAKAVIGNLDTILQQAGDFTFDVSGGRLETSVIVPDIRGVTGFRVIEGSDTGELFQGDIALEAGSNFRITKYDYSGLTVLSLSAISGEGTIAECVCEGDITATDPIRTINGVEPDTSGNINIVGDDCLSPVPLPAEYAVQILDECSKPCCGCPELETLVTDQKRMRDQVQTMENLAAQLEANINVMQTLLSMLGPC